MNRLPQTPLTESWLDGIGKYQVDPAIKKFFQKYLQAHLSLEGIFPESAVPLSNKAIPKPH